mgnify:CR=1 FL=1
MPLSKIQLSESTGRRNLVINGGMQIFQRATAATAATGYTTADRWHISETSDGAYTSERSTDNPFGTGYSIKLQCTTADTSLAATQFARVYQRIEAQNLQHLLYGTSSAKTLTLSFWVKSSKTGTYSILLRKEDNTAYHFIHSYTISSADTWEKKIITITPTAGSTSFITASAGAIANDNAMGFELAFNLAQGSSYAIGTSNTWSSDTNTYGLNGQVNWLDNTSNNLYLAQVQLEVGSLTEFEHRSFGEELLLCKRYYTQITGGSDAFAFPGKGQGSTSVDGTFPLAVPLRAQPTMNSIASRFFTDGGFSSTTATPTANQFVANNDVLAINIGSYSGGASFTNNESGVWGVQSTTLTIDAEL